MKIHERLRHPLVAFASVVFLAAAPSAVDTAFTAFWDAPGPREAAAAADKIVKMPVAFDEAYARLKRGREYPAQPPRGVVRASHHFAAGDFGYTIEVPETYTPSRTYQLRVQLHGGVMGRTDGNVRGSGSIGALAGVEQIYVMPTSWQDAPWWSDAQIENMRAILDAVKRTYNVDENRVVLSGVSDGATANYYFAMRDTTPFASFLTLNGAIAVLQNDSLGIRSELFPQNLLNKPFFMVNGARDPLYPAELVEPYIEHMVQGGVEVLYHQRPEGVHNTVWWPEEKDAFETFVREHARKPFPDRLTWETDMAAETNRAHWLVINALAKPPGTPLKPDLNEFSTDLLGRFGLKLQGTTVVRVVGSSSASTFLLGARRRHHRRAGPGRRKGQQPRRCAGALSGGAADDRRLARRKIPGARRLLQGGRANRDCALFARRALGARGSHARRQHRARGHERRRGVHAARLAGRVRLLEADHGGGERADGVQRACDAERRDADEVGSQGQRPNHALWRRNRRETAALVARRPIMERYGRRWRRTYRSGITHPGTHGRPCAREDPVAQAR